MIFLGSIGGLMFWESLSAVRHGGSTVGSTRREPGGHYWVHGWPLKMRFQRSKLYISAIPPALLGFLIGLLAVVMGVGGGFILVPAMIYLLRMPTSIVVGHLAFPDHLRGGVFDACCMRSPTKASTRSWRRCSSSAASFGVQFGVRYGERLRSDWLRLALARFGAR